MRAEEVVHVLDGGFALCGLGEGQFPGEWPPGHLWTYLWDLDRVTCEKCRDEAKRRAASKPPD